VLIVTLVITNNKQHIQLHLIEYKPTEIDNKFVVTIITNLNDKDFNEQQIFDSFAVSDLFYQILIDYLSLI
jgi:hypothetical protein